MGKNYEFKPLINEENVGIQQSLTPQIWIEYKLRARPLVDKQIRQLLTQN